MRGTAAGMFTMEENSNTMAILRGTPDEEVLDLLLSIQVCGRENVASSELVRKAAIYNICGNIEDCLLN